MCFRRGQKTGGFIMRSKLSLITNLILFVVLCTVQSGRPVVMANYQIKHSDLNSNTGNPLGTGFTYQGRLQRNGSPVDDTCNFLFNLWNAESGGDQIGSDIALDSVPLSNGLFMVALDFGEGAFNGEARWLGISVQCSADVEVIFIGREVITATPYALYAATISDHSLYKRTVIVSPVGTPTENGLILVAGLDGITDASADNPYLVKIEPGIYDLSGTTEGTLNMKEYVDIEGSGEDVTKVTAPGYPDVFPGIPTIRGAANSELRYLTVESSGGVIGGSGSETLSLALNIHGNMRVSHVTAVAFGSTNNTGISIGFGASNLNVLVKDTRVVVNSPSDAIHCNGINVLLIRGLILDNIDVDVSGNCYALGIELTMSTATIRNSSVLVTGADQSVAIENKGLGTAGDEVYLDIYNSEITAADAVMWNNNVPDMTYYSDIFVNIASSLLAGGSIVSGSHEETIVVTCAGVYDEDFIFFPSTCP